MLKYNSCNSIIKNIEVDALVQDQIKVGIKNRNSVLIHAQPFSNCRVIIDDMLYDYTCKLSSCFGLKAEIKTHICNCCDGSSNTIILPSINITFGDNNSPDTAAVSLNRATSIALYIYGMDNDVLLIHIKTEYSPFTVEDIINLRQRAIATNSDKGKCRECFVDIYDNSNNIISTYNIIGWKYNKSNLQLILLSKDQLDDNKADANPYTWELLLDRLLEDAQKDITILYMKLTAFVIEKYGEVQNCNSILFIDDISNDVGKTALTIHIS